MLFFPRHMSGLGSEVLGVNTLQIAALVETFLYAIYLTIFYRSLQALHIRRRRNYGSTRHLYLMIIVFLICSTMNIGTTLACNFNVLKSDGLHMLEYTGSCIENAMITQLVSNTENIGIAVPWINSLKAVLLVTTILLSDSFLVFRCYILWNKQFKVILFPITALFFDAVFGLIYCVAARLTGFDSFIGLAGLTYMIFIPISLIINLCCTLLIAYKIRQVQKQQDQLTWLKSSQMNHVIVSILESGAIYTFWMLAIVIVVLIGLEISWILSYIFLNAVVQITGITFSLIISRIGRGVSPGDSRVEQTRIRSSMRFRAGISHTDSIGMSALDSNSDGMRNVSPSPKGPPSESERIRNNSSRMGHAPLVGFEPPEPACLEP